MPTLTVMLRRLAVLLALLGAVGTAACSSDEPASPPSASATSDSAVDALVQNGLDQLGAGDSEAARVTFENVLELDADNVYGHYNLGYLAQQAGDEATARAHYHAALAADGDFAPALYNMAILTEPSDLRTAVDLYRRSIAADPEQAAAHMRLGFALLHLGETEEGEEHLSRGVTLDPSMADVEAPSYD